MKLKLNEEGNAVLDDGKPVYVNDDGKEIAFDGAQAFAKIGRLNGENTAYKRRFEEAESKLKAFEGIEDAGAALKALETVKNLDNKKLIDAGEVEQVKAAIAKGYEEKLTAAEKRAADLDANLRSEMIGGSFARSKFIAEKIAVPADMIQKTFGDRFKVEEGEIVAYNSHGEKIRTPTGDLASFDDALEVIVSSYPFKEHILKGTGSSGSGARPGNGVGGGAKTIARADFDKLPAAEQMKKVTTDGFEVV